MKLKQKFILISLASIIAYAVLTWGINRCVLLPSFERLENSHAMVNIQRVQATVLQKIDDLDYYCADWAAWNDTYEFVGEGDPDYMDSNLPKETFADGDLTVVMIYDLTGKFVAGETYDLQEETFFELPDFPRSSLPLDHPLLLSAENSDKVTGVFQSSVGPMIVSAEPVTRSNGAGPIRGTMIMGRLLNEEMVTAIADQLFVDVSSEIIEDASQLDPTLASVGSDFEVTDAEYLTARVVVKDISATPVLLLTIDLPRDIHTQGAKTLYTSLLYSLAAGFLIIALLIIISQKLVVYPINKLAGHIVKIRQESKLLPINCAKSNDEIGIVSAEFNELINELNRKNAQQKIAAGEREKIISELFEALSKVKTLSGLLPMCAACKKIRNDKGYWQKIESYLKEHAGAEFTHGICHDCAQKLYPELSQE